MNKDKYIEYALKNFEGKSLDLVLKNIELFYSDEEFCFKHSYKIGQDVLLKKGTFIHGISGFLDSFDWIIDNGFISNDFTGLGSGTNKIKNSIGMWNIKEDCFLKDYINLYSGFTITYNIGRGPDSKTISELVPFHKFDEVTERINNDDKIWSYWGEGTKEVRFIPSLVADKRQIAFIINTESDYAKKMLYADVWNSNFDEEIIKDFIDYRYYPKFVDERNSRTAVTTDRESAIIFGLPAKLIEGVFVGRKIENDVDAIKYIKNRLPNCYICNLDGKIIYE